MINVPETAKVSVTQINVSIQEIYKDRKNSLLEQTITTHFLPPCKCGGHAKHWLQIITAGNILHWVECLSCGKYTELTRSRESAEQNWRDIIAGVIREKRVHWSIGF